MRFPVSPLNACSGQGGRRTPSLGGMLLLLTGSFGLPSAAPTLPGGLGASLIAWTCAARPRNAGPDALRNAAILVVATQGPDPPIRPIMPFASLDARHGGGLPRGNIWYRWARRHVRPLRL